MIDPESNVTAQGVRGGPATEALGSSPFSSRYKLLAVVGSGGMGIVYKACDHETNEIVALKALKPEIASDPLVQERFKNELCLARKITHKNVCRIHEFNRTNGIAYTTMEFIEGESLLAVLTSFGGLRVRKAIDVARQICAGLREAHAQGIVHRDLKPGNIMLDRNGNVKIMDFGIARLMENGGKITGAIVGTPAYMAPEQAQGKPVDARTDIYALGLLTYEMMTGKPAFDGDTPMEVALKQVRELPKPPRQIEPALPAYLELAILKCLEKDPAKRFQSVDALDLALQGCPSTGSAVSALRLKIPRLGPKYREAVLNFMTWLVREAQIQISGLNDAVVDHWPIVVRWLHANYRKPTPQRTGIAFGAALLLGILIAIVSSSDGRNPAASPPQSPVPTELGAKRVVVSEPAKEDPIAMVDRPAVEQDLSLTDGSVTSEYPAPKRTAKPASQRAPTSTVSPKASASVQMSRPEPPAQNLDLQAVTTPTPLASMPADRAPKIEVPGDAKNVQTNTVTASNIYLQVGTFKEEPWAKSALDKLLEQGFPAVMIHKGFLWKRSFRVLVGPYADTTQAEAAQKRLESQGFPKARQVR